MSAEHDDLDGALDAALKKHVRRYGPSAAFEQRLRARLTAAQPTIVAAPRAWRRPLLSFAAGTAVAALALAAVGVRPQRSSQSAWSLVDETVSDHLRVVASTRPPEVESGGIHQVKPWFQGRVDFAPRVAFAGDDDFPLVGGSLGYVRDRKAAVFQFRRRLHAVDLFVFPAEGMPWPADAQARLAGRDVVESTSRGFSVLLWRDADLGYALVSDIARAELEPLVEKITP